MITYSFSESMDHNNGYTVVARMIRVPINQSGVFRPLRDFCGRKYKLSDAHRLHFHIFSHRRSFEWIFEEWITHLSDTIFFLDRHDDKSI